MENNRMNNVDYTKNETPEGYVCAKCGVIHIKLWREYQTVNPKLLCAKCASEDQKENIETMDEDGNFDWEYGLKVDQIGWYVPAIPDEEGVGYWGYTSVPENGIEWWRKLPTFSNEVMK